MSADDRRATHPPSNRRSHLAILAAPMPALMVGLVVMSRAGVPVSLRLLNLAAGVVGVLLAGMASALRTPMSSRPPARGWWVALGFALLGATLIAPGLSGVHRWVGLGPLRLHVGALILPSLLVWVTDMEWVPSVAVALLTLTILVVQPDGAQAAAFAAGWGVCMAMTRGRKATLPFAAAGILAAAAWLRRDPLEPVAYVEGIVGLAADQGMAWGVAGVFALALLPLAFLLHPRRPAAVALTVYMAGTLASARFGDFPVPVLGYGAAPILGYYVAAATLSFTDSGGGSCRA